MGIKTKGRVYQFSMLTLGLLIDIKERISGLVQRRDGRAQPKIEEPDEENRDYEEILPGSENTYGIASDPDGQLSSGLDYPDVAVPADAESQLPYSGSPEHVFPPDLADQTNEPWQNQLDPSTEEDIPLRPSEVDIPYEIQYDQEDDLRVITPGQDKSEFELPDETPEIENPKNNELEPDKFSKKKK